MGGLDRATSGQVSYRGRDLTRASDCELTEYRRRQVGFVFQFYNLIPSLTARENVSIVTEIASQPMRPEQARARLNRELGATTALITHNASIAAMADRVVRLSNGHIVSVEDNPERKDPSEIQW